MNNHKQNGNALQVMTHKVFIRVILFASFTFLAAACATYYHKNFDFNYEFERGDLQQALATLK